MSTVTTAVQSALLGLDRDLHSTGSWELGVGLWAIHEQGDGTVSLEKVGGPEFWQVALSEVICELKEPLPEYAGWVVSFECWVSDSGDAALASEAPDAVDARYLIAALRGGTCVVLEHRRDRPRPRITLDDGRTPPVSSITMHCAHMRVHIAEPFSPVPAPVRAVLARLGIDPSQIAVIGVRPEDMR